MKDERPEYEPYNEAKHYVIATARPPGGAVVQAHGRTHEEAMERLAAKVLWPADVRVWVVGAQPSETTVAEIMNHPMRNPNHVHSNADSHRYNPNLESLRNTGEPRGCVNIAHLPNDEWRSAWLAAARSAQEKREMEL